MKDTQSSFTPSPASIHPFHQKTPHGHGFGTPSSRSATTPRSEHIVTPSDLHLTSPPPSYANLNGQFNPRRISKYTIHSGSSGASTYSSDTSSLRHEKGYYQAAERPDISTVFEEESFEPEHQDGQRGNTDSVPKDHPINTRTSPVRSPHQHHKQQNHSQSSSNGNTNITGNTNGSGNGNGNIGAGGNHTTQALRPRKDTISSVNSNSARSVKSVHPFASAVLRPTSPPPPKTTSGLLSPSQSSGLPSSRSQPNLADLYKASQSPTMPHQVNFVSEEDDRDDEDNCPVCCESLSFTFRLPGEKPHIVPECGHSLHEVCLFF